MSLPEADISTVRSLLFLLFLEMQTHTLTFSYSIHISFLRSLPMFFPVCTLAQCFRLVLSGIQSKEINLVSLYLCVLFFLSYPFLHMFSLTLLLCYTLLHNDTATLCPSTPFYAPFSLLTLSLYPLISSRSPLLKLTKVLERGNEK